MRDRLFKPRSQNTEYSPHKAPWTTGHKTVLEVRVGPACHSCHEESELGVHLRPETQRLQEVCNLHKGCVNSGKVFYHLKTQRHGM